MHLFVYFVRVNFCLFSLPLGVRDWLRFVIVTLPELLFVSSVSDRHIRELINYTSYLKKYFHRGEDKNRRECYEVKAILGPSEMKHHTDFDGGSL